MARPAKVRIVLSQAVNRVDLREMGIPPIGLAYLSAYVKAHESDVEFRFAESSEEILASEPDIVGISAVSQNSGLANVLARELRQSGFEGPILLGGYHITGVPGSLSEDFDLGVLGEGEQTLLEVVRLIRDGGRSWREKRDTVPGVCFSDGRRVVTTGRREQIRPLDSVPHPDREMLAERWAPIHGSVQYLYSSRGCPYACSFCSSSQFWGSARYFSAQYLLDELVDLAGRYHASSFFFYDDLFIADRKRLEVLADLMCAEGLSQEVESLCNVRASEIDDDICRVLKRMNINWVYLGLESVSDSVLKKVNKRATHEENVRALRLLKQHDFKITASFILGMPGETADDMKKTAAFIEENLGTLIDEFMVYPIIPFPGTQIWRDAVARGLIDENPAPETMRRATFSFHPDDYVYLNDAAPRDTFFFYLYYLRFIRLRHWLKRLLGTNHELGLLMGKHVKEIDALEHEIAQATEYVASLETQICKKDGRLDMLDSELEKSINEVALLRSRLAEGTENEQAPATRRNRMLSAVRRSLRPPS